MKTLMTILFASLVLPSCVTYERPPHEGFFLGEREVSFNGQNDRITLGRYDGAFRAVQFVVRDNSVELYQMVIVFGNGERQFIETRMVFGERSRSGIIRLEGGKRHIVAIEFAYRTVGSWKNGRAVIQLFGLR